MMKRLVLNALLVVAFSSCVEQTPKNTSPKKDIEGTWQLVYGEIKEAGIYREIVEKYIRIKP